MPEQLLEPRELAEVLVIAAMVAVFGLYRLFVYLSGAGSATTKAHEQDVEMQAFIVQRLGLTMDDLAAKIRQMDRLQSQIQELSTQNTAFKYQVKLLETQITQQGEQLRSLGETNQRQLRHIANLEHENSTLRTALTETRTAKNRLADELRELRGEIA
jgi:peptidoglycan hydrolase CwlO-like protein